MAPSTTRDRKTPTATPAFEIEFPLLCVEERPVGRVWAGFAMPVLVEDAGRRDEEDSELAVVTASDVVLAEEAAAVDDISVSETLVLLVRVRNGADCVEWVTVTIPDSDGVG